MKYLHQFALCLFLITSTKPSSSASILAIWNNLTIWNTLASSTTFNQCPKVWYMVLSIWIICFQLKHFNSLLKSSHWCFLSRASQSTETGSFGIKPLLMRRAGKSGPWQKTQMKYLTLAIYFFLFYHWFPTCMDLPFKNKNKLLTRSYAFLLSQAA